MVQEYKLLKDLPDVKAGTILKLFSDREYRTDEDEFGDFYSFEIDCIKRNPDFFAPYLFTSTDGVEIFKCDVVWEVTPYGEMEDVIAINSEVGECKYFSTKEKAQEYLDSLVEFKVGDIVYDVIIKEAMKIESIIAGCLITDLHDYKISDHIRKATNDEVISYYQEQGWVKGAKFKFIPDGTERIVERLEFYKGNIVIVEERNKILLGDCELIKEPTYPKSWEEIKELSPDSCYIQPNLDDWWKEVKIEKASWVDKSKNDTFLYSNFKQAQSALAFAQLSQLVRVINGDWEADWEDRGEQKWYPIRFKNKSIKKEYTYLHFVPLCFKTEKQLDFSLEHHRTLWEQYYQL